MYSKTHNALILCVLFAILGAAGCRTVSDHPTPVVNALPKELNKVTLPEYRIEPPDILQINAVQLIPLPPYRIQSLDSLAIQVPNALPIAPITGVYFVEPDGTINLGPSYGTAKVAGMTLDEAKEVIRKQLTIQIKDPEVSISVAQARGVQQIAGEHLVRTDGTVYLGTYGSVQVTGLSLQEAKERIEAHLSAFVQDPEVTVDVIAYNSKVYYVIFDGGGYGQQLYRLPVTGNDTVLDAISQVSGLGPVSSKQRIWVARPSPTEAGCDQVLPVDWVGITTKGRTGTNYQLMPGDRLYVESNRLVRIDTAMARMLAPLERALGFTLLGTSTARQITFFNQFGTFGGNTGSPGFP